jgi:hypothetical protein
MGNAGFCIGGRCGVGLKSFEICLEVREESEEHLRCDLCNVQ